MSLLGERYWSKTARDGALRPPRATRRPFCACASTSATPAARPSRPLGCSASHTRFTAPGTLMGCVGCDTCRPVDANAERLERQFNPVFKTLHRRPIITPSIASAVLSRRRFVQLFLLSLGGGALLYDGPYAGLEVRNFLRSKTRMTVTVESVTGRSYHEESHLTPQPGGGGSGDLQAFPAALPATYDLTIDVHRGVTETFQIEFGLNSGDQSVVVTVHDGGEINVDKQDRPLAIPGRSAL